MKTDYINKYAQHFKLHKSGNKFLNQKFEHVLSLIDDQIYYRISENEWKSCKSGDLIVSVINDIPLHE